MSVLVQIIILSLMFDKYSTINEYRIGGLFSDVNDEIAFRLGVNLMSTKYPYVNFQLLPDTFNVSSYNTLEAQQSVCKLLKRGVIGIFGPSSIHSSIYIQSICDRKEIPHIETHWNVKMKRTNCMVNLYPHPDGLSYAAVDLIKAFHWHKVIVLYENTDSLSRIDPILQLSGHDERNIIIKQLESDISGNFRPLLTAIKKTGETNFVIDCSIGILEEVLRQAQQVGLMTDKYNFVITNLDMQSIDLSPFQYAGTNITGFRIIDPESPTVISIANAIQQIRKRNGQPWDDFDVIAAWKLHLTTALTIDAVQLFYETIYDLATSKTLYLSQESLNCNTSDNWKSGYTIINYMKRKTIQGLTGTVKFGYDGFREDFSLDIVELTPGGLVKIGDWHSINRTISFDRLVNDESDNLLMEGSLFNRTFKVITCLTPPYGMLKETTTQLTGNDRFEGFSIDVIHELSQILGFNYTFIIQEDGANGNLDRSTNEWNGMIREIIDGRADLAITDLTITSERENAVDFTMPFMNLGISILYRKPEPVPPSLFMFASPFSLTVWIMLVVAYFLVSLAFFIMGRLSPSEWTNPYPCVEEPEYLINQFSIRNCLWFTIGALMQQGSDLAPMSISTRTASGVWWFFTLIMVSSYTANLAAFLTVTTLVTSFKNIDELARQTEIKYGAKKDGATANFFRDSNVTTYKLIWSRMASHPDVMTADNDEGVKRVETENYAYLMESTTIEYVTERHCTLAQVGNLLDDKGYGIAMKKYSPYRNDLSTAVLKLQETGKLTALKIKWWKEKRGGGNCARKNEGGEATALDLQNVGGVFLVLFVGSVLAIFVSLSELSMHIYRKTKSINNSFKKQLIKEIRFALKFKQSVKEVESDYNMSDEDETQITGNNLDQKKKIFVK